MNKALLALCCLTLSACSTMTQPVWFESTESLMETHQYQKALEQAQSTTPANTELIKAIHRQANQYRREQLKRVQTYLIKKQWKKAENLLFTLSETQPAHKQFKKAEQQLHQLRAQETLNIKSEVALAKADLLHEESRAELFKRRNTQTEDYWWQSVTPLESKKQDLADTLLALSQEAIAQHNYKLAKSTYKKALSLNEDLKALDIEKQIRTGLNVNNTSTVNQRQSRLILKLNNAMNDENFEQILSLSSTLSKPPFKGKAVKEILKDAKLLLISNAQELDQQGDSIYRQGDISSAIEIWQEAQTLAPDLPGLHDKLVRAQRVKQKLDSLRQSQKQE